MRIMLVNDDGINSPGIWALYDELKRGNDIIVCAPHAQCSGFSHSITIAGKLEARPYQRGDARAFEVFGTPADCALLGLGALAGEVDMVISGINNGYNAACDVHYSGTIGAACEACMQGIPALAVSTRGGNTDFAPTLRCVRHVMNIMQREHEPGVFYSLNVPAGEVHGLMRAPLGGRECVSHYEPAPGEEGRLLYDVSLIHMERAPGSDLDMLDRGWATYTRLMSDWTRA